MKKKQRELQFITEHFLLLITDYLTGNDLCDTTELIALTPFSREEKYYCWDNYTNTEFEDIAPCLKP